MRFLILLAMLFSFSFNIIAQTSSIPPWDGGGTVSDNNGKSGKPVDEGPMKGELLKKLGNALVQGDKACFSHHQSKFSVMPLDNNVLSFYMKIAYPIANAIYKTAKIEPSQCEDCQAPIVYPNIDYVNCILRPANTNHPDYQGLGLIIKGYLNEVDKKGRNIFINEAMKEFKITSESASSMRDGYLDFLAAGGYL